MDSTSSDMLSEGSGEKADSNDSPDMFADCSLQDEESSSDVKVQIEGASMSECKTDTVWYGATLDEIRNGSASCLPPVMPSDSHSVFFQLPIVPCGQPPKPHPHNLRDCWDSEHVRMPFSEHSLYPVSVDREQSVLRQRWELVQEALLKTVVSSQQLETVILSYNSKYSNRWDFSVLHLFFTEVFSEEETNSFFSTLLPQIVRLALQLPTLLTAPIPLLGQHRNHMLSFSQLQVASLLANAFLCTFPRRNTAKWQSEYARYPDINFNRLFQMSGGTVPKPEKLKCLLHYFRRVCTKAPDGVVTYARRYMSQSNIPQWDRSQKLLTKLHITSQGTIEDDGTGLLQVDFANRMVGGGVLGRGCVQEEIRFVICPELIAARLFTEALDSTEALLVVGCERFSNHSGYSNTFKWLGNYQDTTPRDSSGRRLCSVVAIDALKLGNRNVQYTPNNLLRELNKAYVGFHCPEFQPGEQLAGVASGNWGCGVYRGDAKLKTLLQLMAASEAGRHLAYFTFGNSELQDQVYHVYTFLTDKQVTVGQLYRLLCQYYEHSFKGGKFITELYPFLYQTLSEKTNPVTSVCLGYCTLVVISLVTIYYQVIVAWTIFYIFASFTSELGWGSCGHDFNTDNCYSEAANAECLSKSENESWPLTFIQRTCRPVGEICAEKNQTMHNNTHCFNGTYNHLNAIVQRVLSSEEYYRDYALGINGATWESWGILRWEMVLCLLLSWVILYLCLMKGVQSSGKVTYFTAFFPYCVLLALLVRGVTLDGAYEGILFYITPSWESLANAHVWGDAASQTFYALGIGCGSLVTLSSYNRFNNNCHRDAFVVSIANTLTAILAGFVVFAILGFLAKESGVSVKEVVSSGPGLAFITYPEAVLRMPLPQLWAILFFIMLFTLGTGSQFAGVEAINTAIIDQWPSLCKHKQWVAASTCAACFVLALPMCCSGGVYLFTLLDWNTASWAILIIGFAEVALVGWVYGCRYFLDNINEMSMHLSKFTRVYWSISWTVLAPAFLLGVLVLTLNNFTPAYYGEYRFPEWVDGLGWLIGIASILPLPAFALYRLFRAKEVGWELLTPSKLWGPAQSTTLKVSPFGVYENSEKHYNAYESSDKPNSAFDNLENCSCPGSVVVRAEPEPVQNRHSDARAYDNHAFHRENGRTAFLCQSQTNS